MWIVGCSSWHTIRCIASLQVVHCLTPGGALPHSRWYIASRWRTVRSVATANIYQPPRLTLIAVIFRTTLFAIVIRIITTIVISSAFLGFEYLRFLIVPFGSVLGGCSDSNDSLGELLNDCCFALSLAALESRSAYALLFSLAALL